MTQTTASSHPAAIAAVKGCKPLKLSDEAQPLLNDRQRMADYQAALIEKELYADAIRVTAACLSPKQAVWWGVLCLWSLSRPEPAPELWAVIQAVTTWLRNPDDQHRRAAECAGRTAGITTPAGSLGLAAFLSEGSISPRGAPEVAPKPHLAALNVSAALIQASQKLGPGKAEVCQAQFLALAHDVAQGKLSWQ